MIDKFDQFGCSKFLENMLYSNNIEVVQEVENILNSYYN